MSIIVPHPVLLEVDTTPSIDLEVGGVDDLLFDVALELREMHTEFPIYDGPAIVDPSFETQTLETQNKTLMTDILVNAIEVSRTTNPSGGNTIYIGGIIDA